MIKSATPINTVTTFLLSLYHSVSTYRSSSLIHCNVLRSYDRYNEGEFFYSLVTLWKFQPSFWTYFESTAFQTKLLEATSLICFYFQVLGSCFILKDLAVTSLLRLLSFLMLCSLFMLWLMATPASFFYDFLSLHFTMLYSG